jgi:hypothetical protein
MDPDRRLTKDQADRSLRELFREAGHHTAPPGLEARVLERVAAAPPARAVRPLLPAPVLVIGALAGVIVFGWMVSNASPTIRWELPAVDLAPILRSPWLILSGAAAIVLLGLDALLGRRTYALSRS